MGVIDSVNFAIGVTGLTVSCLGLGLAVGSPHLERRTRRYYVAIFAILIAYVFFNLMSQLAQSRRGPGWASYSRFALFFESWTSSVLAPMLTAFLLYRSGEEGVRTKEFRFSAALWAVYTALLALNHFTGAFYAFDAQNVYRRGPWYPLLLLPVALIMAFNLLALWRRRRKLSRRERIACWVYTAVPLLCMLTQMMFYGVYVIVLGSTVAALVMFLYIQNDQAESFARQERENARLRVDIMLSQIQPHFLFNTLAVIQDLCHTGDCERAEDATVKFARYLRGNMDSLGAEAPVPFERELEHTRGYLELEQLRFRENLTVRYDIEATDFTIPTLTLQPIAENAVRHGVRGNPSGAGTITIASRAYPDRWEVTVTDDGPGFDPARLARDNARAHIGIQNVRARLERLRGGTLTVASAPGAGAKVTIILPKGEENLC